MYLIQISINEIDFRKWYKSAKELKKDENRDMYPPRFITQLNCHQRYTLDVTYKIHVIKDGRSTEDYTFNIFVKGNVCMELQE